MEWNLIPYLFSLLDIADLFSPRDKQSRIKEAINKLNITGANVKNIVFYSRFNNKSRSQ